MCRWRLLLLVPVVCIVVFAFGRVSVAQSPDLASNRFGAEDDGGSTVEDEVPEGDSGSCCRVTQPTEEKAFVLISTLDGRLVSIDAQDGTVVWSMYTDSEPLLAGTLSKLQLHSDEKSYRLIPSLDGNLYMYSNGYLKAIPVSTDALLSNSLRFGSDVVAGGRHVTTYGIDLLTGEVTYACTMDGCDRRESVAAKTLIVKRTTQTVRALDALSGIERWNVTVGEHQLSLGIVGAGYGTSGVWDALQVQVEPPNGYVSVSSAKDSRPFWAQQFDSPVAQVWKVSSGGLLEEVSLFDSKVVPTLSFLDIENKARADKLQTQQSVESLLYLGTFQKDLYVLPSPPERRKLRELAITSLRQLEPDRDGIPGDSTSALIPHEEGQLFLERNLRDHYFRGPSQSEMIEYEGECYGNCPACSTDEAGALASSADWTQDTGWYLYKHRTPESVHRLKRLKKWMSKTTDDLLDNSHVTFVWDLYFLWKPMLLLLLSAFVSGYLVRWYWAGTRPQIHLNFAFISPRISVESNVTDTTDLPESSRGSGTGVTMVSQTSQASFVETPTSDEPFVSRFLNDFEPERCLGKGGFGMVFMARNRLDEEKYAIKRISVVNSETAKEKVMREVRALAKLEHPGIVRYYQSWIECPPVGWQEDKDSLILQHCGAPIDPSSSILSPSTTSHHSKNGLSYHKQPPNNDDSLLNDLNRNIFGSGVTFDSHGDSALISSNNERSLSAGPTGDTSMDIVFERSEKEEKGVETRDMELQADTETRKIYLYIQMQLCQEHTLSHWLSNNRSLSSRDRILMFDWFDQVVDAVSYFHDSSLIHRDLKPSNIFFAPSGKLKIGDFGLVTAMQESGQMLTSEQLKQRRSLTHDRHTHNVGTWLYMSPEQVSGQLYTFKVDIYSLGLILVELLVPFDTQMERVNTLQNARRLVFPDKLKQYNTDISLCEQMLDPDPNKRPNCAQIKMIRKVQD